MMKTTLLLASIGVLGVLNTGSLAIAKSALSSSLSFVAEVDTTHAFAGNGSEGILPTNSMIIGNDGNLYGTTQYDGNGGGGTFYKVTATGATRNPTTTYTVLHHFNDGSVANDGAGCFGRLAKDNSGYIYGTCEGGGAHGYGVVYRINPSNGTVTILYSFGSISNDGHYPWGGVAIDTATGNLYGTTWTGVGNTACAGSGGVSSAYCGTIWKVAPSGGGWTYTVLHRFSGYWDGEEVYAAVTFATDGKLYGKARSGSGSRDILFRYNLSTSTYSVIYNAFPAGGDGIGGLTQIPTSFTSGGKLEFWGTTQVGGINGLGSVYKLSETSAGSGSFTYTTMHSFDDASGGGWYEGYYPLSELVFSTNLQGAGGDASGALYGTTWAGSFSGEGTLYRIDLSGNFDDLNYGAATIYNGDALAGGPWGLVQGSIVNGTSSKPVLFGSSAGGGANNTGWLWHFWWYI
jgi:uncharacterized repeat protein (TIGR03803 family)